MCFGGGGGGGNQDPLSPPDRARVDEAEKQARISEGTDRINEQFSRFDDSYYDRIRNDYVDYYKPQLEDKYEDARRQLITNLNAQRLNESSAGNREQAKLAKEFAIQQAGIADKGLGAADDLRSNVETNRANLVQQLEAGSGVASVANAAASKAAALTAKPAYSPLADVFANFANQYARNQQLRSEGYFGGVRKPNEQQQTQSSEKSVKVVG